MGSHTGRIACEEHAACGRASRFPAKRPVRVVRLAPQLPFSPSRLPLNSGLVAVDFRCGRGPPSRSAINAFISAISSRCALMISSASWKPAKTSEGRLGSGCLPRLILVCSRNDSDMFSAAVDGDEARRGFCGRPACEPADRGSGPVRLSRWRSNDAGSSPLYSRHHRPCSGCEADKAILRRHELRQKILRC